MTNSEFNYGRRLYTLATISQHLPAGGKYLIQDIIISDGITIDNFLEYTDEFIGIVFLENGIVVEDGKGNLRWFWEVE